MSGLDNNILLDFRSFKERGLSTVPVRLCRLSASLLESWHENGWFGRRWHGFGSFVSVQLHEIIASPESLRILAFNAR